MFKKFLKWLGMTVVLYMIASAWEDRDKKTEK